MSVVVDLPGELEEGGGRNDGAWLAKIKIRKEVLEMPRATKKHGEL